MKLIPLGILLLCLHGHSQTKPRLAVWTAQWIEPEYEEDSILRPCPLLSKTFHSTKRLRSATLYITSHGLYHAAINGKKAGNAELTPGWTSYHQRLQYQQYEVKNLLQKGTNTIEVILASGWYRGILGLDMSSNRYGKTLGLLFQLELIYSDGTKQRIQSDSSWKSAASNIRYAELYNGEMIDAGYTINKWKPVKTVSYPMTNLVPTISEPVRKQERFAARKIFVTRAGDTVLDFGQNLVGWVQLKVKGNAGDSVTIEHAEMLDRAKNFYTANLRSAKARDVYILKGGSTETFEPHFTFHGFRYVRLKGMRLKKLELPNEKSDWNITAVAVYSDMKKTGSFECSNPLLNRLQQNIAWSLNGNFIDVPTDCPQRDERLGWMGDAMIFCRTAAFNRNVHLFFKKWLGDVSADQFANGAVPQVVPNILGEWGGSSGWADAATVVPWTMYEVYGDKELLQEQYPSMKAWVKYMSDNSVDGIFKKGFQFGDWLSFRSEGIVDRSALTDVYLVSQCFFAYSTQIMINAAKVLNKKEDESFYTQLLEKIKTAFRDEYVTPNGRLMSNTQTAYVLALQFDLLPESMRPDAAKKLVENIADYKYHITTGFLGTPYICHVLSRFGYSDVAYRLLLQEDYPGWLYPVKMGATTIWERWDGIKPDSTFQDPEMNSFNHYAYGAIGDWMYRVMAGINADATEAGYKKIIIKPVPGGNITWVKAAYEGPYGTINVHWKIMDGKFVMDVDVPINTAADIIVPSVSGKTPLHKKVVAGYYHFEN